MRDYNQLSRNEQTSVQPIETNTEKTNGQGYKFTENPFFVTCEKLLIAKCACGCVLQFLEILQTWE